MRTFVAIMTNNYKKYIIMIRKIATLCLLAFGLTVTAQTHVLDVNTKKLGAPVQPTISKVRSSILRSPEQGRS